MPYNEWQVMNMSYFSNCNIQTLYYGRNVSYSRYDYYDGLFWNQGNLKSVEIGPMVIRLEANLFRGCKGLEIIEIPSNVKIIGNSTFEDCSSLQDIIINEGLQEISSMAFKNCKSIEKISLPGSLTRINSEAFVGCTGITKVYSMVKEPFDIAESTFAGITYLNSTLYVPTGTKSLYQERTGWKDFISIVETDDFEEIPDIPEKPKCATPTISYENWNIKFECETEGAQIVSEVKPTDLKSSTDIEVGLTPTYVITAYAIAEGYHKSDVATATISWRYGRPVIIQGFSNVNLDETTSVCDVNNDGTVDVADIATIIDKMATSARLQNEMKE